MALLILLNLGFFVSFFFPFKKGIHSFINLPPIYIIVSFNNTLCVFCPVSSLHIYLQFHVLCFMDLSCSAWPLEHVGYRFCLLSTFVYLILLTCVICRSISTDFSHHFELDSPPALQAWQLLIGCRVLQILPCWALDVFVFLQFFESFLLVYD